MILYDLEHRFSSLDLVVDGVVLRGASLGSKFRLDLQIFFLNGFLDLCKTSSSVENVHGCSVLSTNLHFLDLPRTDRL